MHSRIWIWLCLVVAVATRVSAWQDAPAEIPWHAKLADAQRAAQAGRKLVLVHFCMNGCQPCSRMESTTLRDSAVVDIVKSSYVPVRLNIHDFVDNQRLAKQYNVQSFPTDLILTPAGLEVGRSTGYQSAEIYATRLSATAQSAGLFAAREQVSLLGTNARGSLDQIQQSAKQAGSEIGLTVNNQFAAGKTALLNQSRQLTQAAKSQERQTRSELAQQAATTRQQWTDETNRLQQETTAAVGQARQQINHTIDQSKQAVDAAANNAQHEIDSKVTSANTIINQTIDNANQKLTNMALAARGQYLPGSTRSAQNVSTGTEPASHESTDTGTKTPNLEQPAQSDSAATNETGDQPQPEQDSAVGETGSESNPASETNSVYGPTAGTPAKDDAESVYGRSPSATSPTNSKAPNSTATATPSPARPRAEIQPGTTREQRSSAASIPASKAPSVALDGFCPVTLAEKNDLARAEKWGAEDPRWSTAWVKGDKRFGAIHRGRTYLFASAAAQTSFLADPDRYSPALSGYDPVSFVEQNQLVEGKRHIGTSVGGELFLFATKENQKRFEDSVRQKTGEFLNPVRQATRGTTTKTIR